MFFSEHCFVINIICGDAYIMATFCACHGFNILVTAPASTSQSLLKGFEAERGISRIDRCLLQKNIGNFITVANSKCCQLRWRPGHLREKLDP